MTPKADEKRAESKPIFRLSSGISHLSSPEFPVRLESEGKSTGCLRFKVAHLKWKNEK
jgi:hypothetical protein